MCRYLLAYPQFDYMTRHVSRYNAHEYYTCHFRKYAKTVLSAGKFELTAIYWYRYGAILLAAVAISLSAYREGLPVQYSGTPVSECPTRVFLPLQPLRDPRATTPLRHQSKAPRQPRPERDTRARQVLYATPAAARNGTKAVRSL